MRNDSVATDTDYSLVFKFRMDNKEPWDTQSKEIKSKLEQSLSLHESYHLKLWIGTVKNLKQHLCDTKTAIFGEKIITYVDVIGTVIDKLTYEKANIYVCTLAIFYLR